MIGTVVIWSMNMRKVYGGWCADQCGCGIYMNHLPMRIEGQSEYVRHAHYVSTQTEQPKAYLHERNQPLHIKHEKLWKKTMEDFKRS